MFNGGIHFILLVQYPNTIGGRTSWTCHIISVQNQNGCLILAIKINCIHVGTASKEWHIESIFLTQWSKHKLHYINHQIKLFWVMQASSKITVRASIISKIVAASFPWIGQIVEELGYTYKQGFWNHAESPSSAHTKWYWAWTMSVEL